MIRWISALAVALALHGMLCALVAWTLEPDETSVRDESPALEMSSVELSFSQQEDEAAQPAQAASVESAAHPQSSREVPDPQLRPIEPQGLLPASDAVPEVRPPTLQEKPTEDLTPPAVQPEEASVESAPSTPAPRTERVEVPPSLPEGVVVKPVYPESAKRRGEEGTVVLDIRVAVDGSVAEVAVAESCGFDVLDQAAVRAVKKARFAPARRDGAVVEGRVRLPVRFRLKN